MAKLGRPLSMPADLRRKEIFSAAERLFGEKGFDKTTMTDIALATGMSKKTLYVYFADKQALLRSLVSSSYIWTEDAFETQRGDNIQYLIACLKTIAEHVLSERHIYLCRLAIAERDTLSKFTDIFYDMGIRTGREHLIAAVKDLQRHQLKVQLDAETMADLLFGACIAKPFLDLLIQQKSIALEQINQKIEETVDIFFKDL